MFYEYKLFPEFVRKKGRRDDPRICRAVSYFATYLKFFTNFKVDFFQLVYLVRVRCVKRVQDHQKWPSFIYVIEHMAIGTWILSLLLEKVRAILSFCYCETKFEFFRPRSYWKVFFQCGFLVENPCLHIWHWIHDMTHTLQSKSRGLPPKSVKRRVGCITQCSFKKMNETFGNRFVNFLKFNLN